LLVVGVVNGVVVDVVVVVRDDDGTLRAPSVLDHCRQTLVVKAAVCE
jgi:hypothetical protein